MKLITYLLIINLSISVSNAVGSLTSDSPCTLAQGATRCDVTLSAQVSNTPVSCIWKTTPSLGLVACSGSASWNVIWEWTNLTGHTMQLKAHTSTPSNNQTDFDQGSLLDQINVIASPSASGMLTSDSPCTLTQGATRCDVTLSAQVPDTPVSCIWKTTPSLGLVACSGSSNWNMIWEWTNLAGHTMELRSHASYPSNNQSDFDQGTYLDQINVIAQNQIPTVAGGGSVFAWYKHTVGGSLPDDSTGRVMPFGIIKNYHQIDSASGQPVRDIVKSQLQTMYVEGQRRIGVGFFYGRSSQWISHGTWINSRAKLGSNGKLYYIEPQYLANLSSFVADIKAQGFNQVALNFYPGGVNSPSTWNNWFGSYLVDMSYSFVDGTISTTGVDPNDPQAWQKVPIWRENWQVIKAVTGVLAGSQIDFIVDIQNEAIPLVDSEGYVSCPNVQTNTSCSCSNSGTANWDRCLAAYPNDLMFHQERIESMMNKLWIKFRNNFPNIKTAGYSIISSSDWQLEQRSQTMSNIYGSDFPPYLKLHSYNMSTPSVTAILSRAKSLPGGGSIIIGEAYYNNMASAQAFRNAQQATGANIQFLMQWPKSASDGYNHSVPLSFEEYMLENY